MIYSITKKSGSCRETKNIKKIRANASKKCSYSSNNYSSSGLNPDTSLSSDNDCDEDRQPPESKEINELDHVVTNNRNKNNNKRNDAIGNELNFDNNLSVSSRTKDPLPVVTVRLRGGKKQRAMMVSGLKYLWDSGTARYT